MTQNYFLRHAILTITSATVLTVAILFSAIFSDVYAAPRDGVRCPNGYEARFDPEQKVMRCERTITNIRPTVCDPSAPEFVIYRTEKGQDFCVRTVDINLATQFLKDADSRRKSAVCAKDAEDSIWLLELDANGLRDRCKGQRFEWIYPSQQ